MREPPTPSSAIVVGIDGSRAALAAALWAVDEAVSRDIPLRLIYAVEPRPSPLDPGDAARDLAEAELAVREAFMAVESLEKPVKVEVQIVQDRPERALFEASRSATMLCVGALGLRHATGWRLGSTSSAVSRTALCAVAIIRRHDPSPTRPGWIVVEVDDSPDSIWILGRALDEALLRHAPLRALTAWQPRFTDVHDAHAAADNNKLIRAHLEHRLAPWQRRYPDLDVMAVSVQGSIMNYLACHMGSIQLVVVGQQRGEGLTDFVGPAAQAVLHDTNCSVLICERHSGL